MKPEATTGWRSGMPDLEELTDHDLDGIKIGYEDLARRARDDLRRGVNDTDAPDV